MHTECKLYPPPAEPKTQTHFSRQGGNPTYPGALFPIGTPTAETAKLSDPISLLTVHLSSASLATSKAAWLQPESPTETLSSLTQKPGLHFTLCG